MLYSFQCSNYLVTSQPSIMAHCQMFVFHFAKTSSTKISQELNPCDETKRKGKKQLIFSKLSFSLYNVTASLQMNGHLLSLFSQQRKIQLLLVIQARMRSRSSIPIDTTSSELFTCQKGQTHHLLPCLSSTTRAYSGKC